MAEAEAADMRAEEIEILDDDEEGADSGASQVQPPALPNLPTTLAWLTADWEVWGGELSQVQLSDPPWTRQPESSQQAAGRLSGAAERRRR